MAKVSVIIPIYKVENFIVRCTKSLLQQTLNDVEYIFVDDATPDRSIELLEEVIGQYSERKGQVRLLKHQTNKGLPAARNTGLSVAKGEYIFHCDSDDFVEPKMLERLYLKAKSDEADIVWCDWWLSFERNERYMKQPGYATPMEALKGLLEGTMKFNVWNKLVKRTLYADYNIQFPSGYGMGEDMTMIRLFARAGKVSYLAEAFYHYVQLNTGAFCKTENKQHLIDLRHNVSLVEDDLWSLYGKEIETELAFFKLNVKFPFLITDNPAKYKLWEAWFPEANKFIIKNKNISLRSRLLQLAAWKKQYWLVKLYYICIHRLVYGVIYR